MRSIKSLLVGLAVLGSATACVSTNTTMLGASSGTAVAATDPASLTLYRTAAQVPGPYKELALLNSTGASMMTNEKQMFESMRREAAKVGANAVILDAITEPSPGIQVAAAIFGVPANRKGKALAILVEGQPVVPAPVKARNSGR